MIKIKNAPTAVTAAIEKVDETRKEWARVNSIDTATRLKVLAENTFCDEDGERITMPCWDFMMSEPDFEKYLRLAYAENCKKGIDSGGYEFNFYPVLKAVWDAEDALIDAVAPDLPGVMTADVVRGIKNSPKLREQFLKIFGF